MTFLFFLISKLAARYNFTKQKNCRVRKINLINTKRLTQITKVYQYVKRRPGATMEQIINHLDNNNLGELAIRTIGQIMYDLREELDVDIKFDRSLWGYKIYSTDNIEIENLIDLLQTAKSIGFMANDLIELKKMEEFVQLSNSSNKGKENMQELMDACINSREIEFDYHKYEDKLSKKRRVQPYQIREYNGIWYIIGIEPDKIAVEPNPELVKFRYYGLDRMHNLKNGSPFIRDKQKEYINHYNDVIGIVNGHHYQTGLNEIKSETIILRVEKMSWNYIKALPWHHSQKKVNESGNYVEFELNIKPTSELEQLILEWTPRVKVLQPKKLRGEIIEKLKEALDYYN